MGQRGPAPKPTALKTLAGNPGKRPLNTREPRPTAQPPRCPSWLALAAKREWRRVVPELERLGLLTLIDMAALAAYCQSYARWQQAEMALAAGGLSVELTRIDHDGNEVVYAIQSRPEVAVSQKERQLMKAFLAEFGLTPASRGRLSLPETPVADPFDEFLSRKRG